jgi:type IV secretory pathway TrbD component
VAVGRGLWGWGEGGLVGDVLVEEVGLFLEGWISGYGACVWFVFVVIVIAPLSLDDSVRRYYRGITE